MHPTTKRKISILAHTANITDKVTTLIGVLTMGISFEGNPLFRMNLEFYGIPLGILLFVFTGWVYVEFLRRKEKQWADMVLVFAAFGFTAVTIHNTLILLFGA